MHELDDTLLRLRAEPVAMPDGLEGAVMAGLGRRRERQVARRGLVLASGVALFVGVAGAVVPGAGVPGASGSADALPLGMPAAAPSHLLAD